MFGWGAPAKYRSNESPATTPAEGVDLTILYEADEDMINNYSLLAVNPDAPFADADGNPVSDVYINTEGAAALINWMLSEKGKAAIADYGYADYGEYLFYLTEDGPTSAADIHRPRIQTRVIRMSTTTSVNDSGLLGYLLPLFEEAYGYTVEVTSAGTGKAIANAQNGNAICCWFTPRARRRPLWMAATPMCCPASIVSG